MKFKIDENLPVDLKSVFLSGGHEADSVYDESLDGQPDNRIALACREENRILITVDLDFADLRVFRPEDFPGIIVLRLSHLDKHGVLKTCQNLIPILERESVEGKLWIVEEHRIRVRER